jgi:aspartate aminotransferase-like enzyme
VTVINAPAGINSDDLVQKILQQHNILIAGCFGYLKGNVFRIGHMGENARKEFAAVTLKAIQQTLENEGVSFKANMESVFWGMFEE